MIFEFMTLPLNNVLNVKLQNLVIHFITEKMADHLQDVKSVQNQLQLNVVVRSAQHLQYFHCIEIQFLLGRNSNVLFIDRIFSESPGHGLATIALKEICSYADKHDVTLWLEVKPFTKNDGDTPKMNELQLIAWYSRQGFHIEDFLSQTGKTKSEMGGFIDMIRQPQT